MKSSLAIKVALFAALIALMVGLSRLVDLTAFFYPSRIQEILAMAGVLAPLWPTLMLWVIHSRK